jgi:hypothetical protein
MAKRPLSVTILGLLMIAAGAVGIAYHLGDFKGAHHSTPDVFLLLALRLFAIVAGVLMLRGYSWARWLALAWLAFHVAVSAFDSWQKFGMHAVLFVVFAIFLFRPNARTFFGAKRA